MSSDRNVYVSFNVILFITAYNIMCVYIIHVYMYLYVLFTYVLNNWFRLRIECNLQLHVQLPLNNP